MNKSSGRILGNSSARVKHAELLPRPARFCSIPREWLRSNRGVIFVTVMALVLYQSDFEWQIKQQASLTPRSSAQI